MNDKMREALNDQINAELFSSYLYLSMAAFLESKGLKGFSTWMKTQAYEEMTHASKFYDYVNERGGSVIMKAIGAPKTEWSSPLEVFQDVLAHEKKVTGLINRLVDLAIAESDHATNNFLQWFVAEQVEEEASANDVLDQLKIAKDSPNALLLLDRELGARVMPIPMNTKGDA